MNIVCVEPLGISQKRFEELKSHYAALGNRFVYYMDRQEDEQTLVARMKDADVVVVSNIKLTQPTLVQCSALKYISVAFTGLDHIDLAYCDERGIEVQNAAGYSTTAVSELAIGMMLDLLRGITALDGAIRNGQGRGAFLGSELRGKTVGIVGTGAIGTATAKLLKAFGARVVAYSRSRRPEVEALGVEYVSLDRLLNMSDIVSLHTPLTTETRTLIGRNELARMKPSALLVNTARGPVCDMTAVADALNKGVISGAAFDVFEQEPPLPSTHPLLGAPHCLLTPHVAFATKESFAMRADIVFSHVDEWLQK